jgi:hypothetical protein
MNNTVNNWIAPEEITIPDFMIIGAMKSATSSLHYILNQHPEVFIADREIGFFDIDNIYQHPDFIFFQNGKWYFQDMDKNRELLWDWYADHFSKSKKGQLIGEDSTSYLASEIAAKRISLQKKEMKFIALLRQPTMRCYSEYWHKLRTGRATYSFEDTLRYYPESILERSQYLRQIENWIKYIPRENICFVIFEEFLSDKQSQLQRICNFLELDYYHLPKEAFKTKKNSARLALFPKLNAFKNRVFRNFGNNRYSNLLPITPSKLNSSATFSKIISGLHLAINPLLRKSKPKINPETKSFVDNYFKKQLQGIDELIDKEVTKIWFN